MRLLTPKQVQWIDSYIESEEGIPLAYVMEQAGRSIYEVVHRIARDNRLWNMVYLVGSGNNGGDALVAARLAALHPEYTVSVIIVGDPQKGSPLLQEQYQILTAVCPTISIYQYTDSMSFDLQASLNEAGIIVDGIFGTGFHGELPESIQGLCAVCQRWKEENEQRRIVAIDVPSGIDAKSGAVSKGTLVADETVTLLYPKVGMLVYPARTYCGNIRVATIGHGIPPAFMTAHIHEDGPKHMYWNEPDELTIPKRKATAHKGIHGHVYVYGGVRGMYGAAILSAEGALRAGAGKVTLCVNPEDMAGYISLSRPEMMVRAKDAIDGHDHHSTFVVGPGGGRSEEDKKAMLSVIDRCEQSMVIDADGIMTLASEGISYIKELAQRLQSSQKGIVLTPHYGEFSALTGISISRISEDPVRMAYDFAKETGVTLVLKGQPTIIAFPNNTVFLNTRGNPYMGTGGMGDVLSGVIASLMNQCDSLEAAVRLAVYLHSRAGDIALEHRGPGFSPTEVAKYIGQVWMELDRREGGGL